MHHSNTDIRIQPDSVDVNIFISSILGLVIMLFYFFLPVLLKEISTQ